MAVLDGAVVLVLIVTLLAAFGIAAAFFGVDSGPGIGDDRRHEITSWL